LLLFRDPYHLQEEDARSWLEDEVAAVLRRDGISHAKLTRLVPPSSHAYGGFDWLLELHAPSGTESAWREDLAVMVGDLRLLGMAPLVAVADDHNAVELQAP
jgi:hypothetical protein